jgi:hypothetical protein
MKNIFLALSLLSVYTQAYAQFNTVIFKKDVYLNWEARNNVCRLGDINKDGYDDILIYDCSQRAALIFLGGSPMDTMPRYTIHFNDTLPRFGGVVALDINGDNVNDIVISTAKTINGYPTPGDIRIFYGAALLIQSLI